ncbi:hypothetical protein D3Z53_06920 [Lachnospiraceae bacterium]|jgi:hypothetical protein|nr:hypothetical protein [Lachnospiraceae bacterium]
MEQGQCTCIKRRLFLISGKVNKVLHIFFEKIPGDPVSKTASPVFEIHIRPNQQSLNNGGTA